jgi:hypothetical protein
MPLFPDIDALETYVDTNIIANGVEYITGPINNKALNGCIEFIRKSPLNWGKARLEVSGGDIVLTDDYLGVVVFSTVTPDSLSFGDNIYFQYVFINMTTGAIPLDTPSFYYNTTGQAISSLPANSVTVLYKVTNDIWVIGDSAGGGGGSTQKQPLTYKVGTTPGAPLAGTSTWQLPAFLNSYVTLFIGNAFTPLSDQGDGFPYVTKPLASDTLTVTNYTWNNGDSLSFILITP